MSIQLFGRSYNQYGDSNADILLKTKGQVKIQWGNKFIDLIKDGKIAVDSNFIFSVKDISKIGVKNGIYIVNGESVYLKENNSLINLIGETGNTYVSFMEGQETTPEAKHNALVNIGFIYNSLEDLTPESLKNGIIYIESEQQLYTVQEGVLSEFKVRVPNPFIEQFIIQKTDNKNGALIIKGSGLSNAIAFDTFTVYAENDDGIIDANDSLIVKANNQNQITVNKESTTIHTSLLTNSIKSLSATENTGFRLYFTDGQSVLEVDKIIERSSLYNSDEEGSIILYPEYWLLNNRVIKEAIAHDDTPEDSEEDGNTEPTNLIDITLFQDCTYKVGDILYTYKQEDIEEDTGETDEDGDPVTNIISSYAKVEFEITNINGKEIQVKCSEALSESTIKNFANKFIFLVKSSENKLPIRLKENNIDIVEYGEEEVIKTRIGNLSEIKDGEESGIYTNKLILGGEEEKNFPKYIETLNSLVSNLNINDTDDYNCVLVSIGLLKKVFKEIQDIVNQLQQKVEIVDQLQTKVETIEADLDAIKQQLAT